MNTKERTLIEVTEANFDAEVIKAKVPVIVDFYADYCIPCRIFKPFLARFAGLVSEDVLRGALTGDAK